MEVDSVAGAPAMAADTDGTFTFELANFLSSEEGSKRLSENFEVGGFLWNLLVFPKGNNSLNKSRDAAKERHLSCYLAAPQCVLPAPAPRHRPNRPCPRRPRRRARDPRLTAPPPSPPPAAPQDPPHGRGDPGQEVQPRGQVHPPGPAQ